MRDVLSFFRALLASPSEVGALTQALITHFGRERLQIIECAPALVDLLQQRFPHARITVPI